MRESAYRQERKKRGKYSSTRERERNFSDRLDEKGAFECIKVHTTFLRRVCARWIFLLFILREIQQATRVKILRRGKIRVKWKDALPHCTRWISLLKLSGEEDEKSQVAAAFSFVLSQKTKSTRQIIRTKQKREEFIHKWNQFSGCPRDRGISTPPPPLVRRRVFLIDVIPLSLRSVSLSAALSLSADDEYSLEWCFSYSHAASLCTIYAVLDKCTKIFSYLRIINV